MEDKEVDVSIESSARLNVSLIKVCTDDNACSILWMYTNCQYTLAHSGSSTAKLPFKFL